MSRRPLSAWFSFPLTRSERWLIGGILLIFLLGLITKQIVEEPATEDESPVLYRHPGRSE